MTKLPSADLAGRRILVVEDEFIIADDIVRAFRRRGAEIVGPVPSLERAMALAASADRLDGAVLDVNLRGVMAYPLADALDARGVPFIFATGDEDRTLPERYDHVPRCVKPVDPAVMARVLANRLLRQTRGD